MFMVLKEELVAITNICKKEEERLVAMAVKCELREEKIAAMAVRKLEAMAAKAKRKEELEAVLEFCGENKQKLRPWSSCAKRRRPLCSSKYRRHSWGRRITSLTRLPCRRIGVGVAASPGGAEPRRRAEEAEEREGGIDHDHASIRGSGCSM
ncbi:hypothetical protein AAFF_G00301420 [Aldrovandia affinis]|uniref:Uncharacterized protein n=1 Tax=Aldrovandia affinis TaxID=143900 RepID=A0AAD7SQ45_9TELE|nr:hypothetical protein AAFF_G00301420 [Aldrovandia affinis]